MEHVPTPTKAPTAALVGTAVLGALGLYAPGLDQGVLLAAERQAVLDVPARSVRALATVASSVASTASPRRTGTAGRLGLPVVFCDRTTRNAVPDVPNASAAAMKSVGVQGVAEPSALAVSGERLVVEKVRAGNVTVAVAEDPPGRG